MMKGRSGGYSEQGVFRVRVRISSVCGLCKASQGRRSIHIFCGCPMEDRGPFQAGRCQVGFTGLLLRNLI